MAGDATARTIRCCGRSRSCWPRTASCSGRWPTRPRRAASASPGSSCSRPPRSARARSRSAASNWALDGASQPVGAAMRLDASMARIGALAAGDRRAGRDFPHARSGCATSCSRTRPTSGRCSTASTSRSRPGRRSRSSGRTAPARRRSPSCCAASTTRKRGAIEVDGIDLRDLDLDAWRIACHRGVPGLHPLRAAAPRQRRAQRRERRRHPRRAARGGRERARRPRHDPGARLSRRHRPLGRSVATHRARARALCAVPARRGTGAPRRADRATRRARRGRDLRPHPRARRASARRS